MTAPDRLAEIRERLDAATSGPWIAIGPDDEYLRRGDVASAGYPGRRVVICEHHAPDDLRWLLGEVERLTEAEGAAAMYAGIAHDQRDEARAEVARLTAALDAVRALVDEADPDGTRAHEGRITAALLRAALDATPTTTNEEDA
ncbi:MAG: hypothetical protein ACO1ON_12935 [Nocardioides sp.]